MPVATLPPPGWKKETNRCTTKRVILNKKRTFKQGYPTFQLHHVVDDQWVKLLSIH